MTREEGINKIAELMDGAHICVMTTIDEDGQLVSRPMALQNEAFDGELWFFTSTQSHKLEQIAAEPNVNVAFEHSNSYVSLSGRAEAITDRAKTEQLWSPAMKGWFPDGIDSPDLQLLKVTVSSAQYWDSSNNKLVTLFAYVKATVTGERPQVGENQAVDLEN